MGAGPHANRRVKALSAVPVGRTLVRRGLAGNPRPCGRAEARPTAWATRHSDGPTPSPDRASNFSGGRDPWERRLRCDSASRWAHYPDRYWKNPALALTGRMDRHFTALWDHGHIKFWSMRTLGALLTEAGFVDVRFERVGRVPALAKSMIAIARKP